MLEQPELLLQPWTAAGRRDIRATTGLLVGFASWQLPARALWRRLLFPQVLEVREIEDESLLFTMQRSWTLLPWREVREAEGHFVGRILGGVVQDMAFCRFATRQDDRGARALFVSPRGKSLAQLHDDEKGLRLVYTSAVEGDPFRKMLLLAAALAL